MSGLVSKKTLIQPRCTEADANKHAHIGHNLAIGRVARPTLPPGSARLASALLSSTLFVEQHRRPRNSLSPTTDSGSDYHGPTP